MIVQKYPRQFFVKPDKSLYKKLIKSFIIARKKFLLAALTYLESKIKHKNYLGG